MTLRDRIAAALREAEVGEDAGRLSTLRLIEAAFRDRDMALRSEGVENGASEDEVRAILYRMADQRHESARAFEEAARLEQAERKRAEASVIEEFLPRALSAEETAAAIDGVVNEAGAESIRDLGRVMGLLKARYPGRMDFAEAGRLVKQRLGEKAAANR
jgi:uncharacterized protein